MGSFSVLGFPRRERTRVGERCVRFVTLVPNSGRGDVAARVPVTNIDYRRTRIHLTNEPLHHVLDNSIRAAQTSDRV